MSGVSRSVYQKVCEENKRLKTDISILVGEYDIFYTKTLEKWRKEFAKELALRKEISEWAKEYITEHPELNIPKI